MTSPTGPSRLEDTSQEVFLDVVERLDRRSLEALSQCSKELNLRIRPVLFKAVGLYSSTVYPFIKVARKDGVLASSVRDLTIDCGANDVCYASDAVIPSLSSLRSLSITGNEKHPPFRPGSSGLGISCPIQAYRSKQSIEQALAQSPSWLPGLKSCKSPPLARQDERRR